MVKITNEYLYKKCLYIKEHVKSIELKADIDAFGVHEEYKIDIYKDIKNDCFSYSVSIKYFSTGSSFRDFGVSGVINPISFWVNLLESKYNFNEIDSSIDDALKRILDL